jgi:2-methylisocitrate lyase-like PEP mutase family enzyme
MPNDVEDAARRKRRVFRELLARPGCTIMPGGFSPLYARMAEQIGFECFFIAGSQMSAYLLGVPDTGVIGLRDIADHARNVAARTDIPILVDCDTGFGNAVNVHFTVGEMIRAGVAGMQIEDQEAPKKSGTSAGRRCISIPEAVGKIQAAVAARDALDPSFVICARVDSIGAQGTTPTETRDRCIAYMRDGGADLVWLNSVQTREELGSIAAAVPGPLLTIWGGPSPAPTLAEYDQLGVRIALFPVIAATAGMQASWEVLSDLKARGTLALDAHAERVAKSPWGAARLGTIIDNTIVRRIEEAYVPKESQRDYASTWGHEGLISSSKSGQSGIAKE